MAKKYFFFVIVFSIVLYKCGTYFERTVSPRWITLKILDQRLSNWKWIDRGAMPRWLVLALQMPDHTPSISACDWVVLQEGLSLCERDVFLGDAAVDHLILLKIHPERFSFSVHVAPEEYRDIDEWADLLGSEVVINGSYYGKGGYPTTPIKSEGKQWGPLDYQPTHGAFVADQFGGRVIPLNGRASLEDATKSFTSVMVSYPLLVDSDGPSRAGGNDSWLANRTFIATTSDGMILIGVTQNAFFSLRGLAKFLKSAPLGIRYALNLDGGPLSSLAIRAGIDRRSYYGEWEFSGSSQSLRQLHAGLPKKK